MEIEVTGEYLVPGKFPIKTEREHYERYKFSSKFVKDKDILDIACGVGYGCKMYTESGARRVTGIDILETNIKFAQENYKDNKVTFYQNDIYNLDYNEEFDIITSFETIEHLKDDNLALRKLFQALKPEGVLIISTPNRKITSPGVKKISDKPLNEFHCREYTLREFKDLVKRNEFIIKKIFGQRNRLFFPINILNKIINRYLKPDENSNAELKRTFLSSARYYTLVLEKYSY